MGVFDFLKKKELEKIQKLETLNQELRGQLMTKEWDYDRLQEKLQLKENDCEQLREENLLLNEKKALFSNYENLADIEKEKNKILSDIQRNKEIFYSHKLNLEGEIEKLKEESDLLSNEISSKKSEILQLNDVILLQEFGLYEPIYDFATSDEYKERLKLVREKQKECIWNESAALCSKEWAINGSYSKGDVFIKKSIKQIVRSFNNECDVLISKVKFNNAEAYIHKIIKSYDDLNKLHEPMCVHITQSYLNLKIKELRLAYEYALKRQAEKEEQRSIREQMREEAKLMEEIEMRRKEVAKELSHYNRQAIQVEELLLKAPEEDKQHLIERKSFITDRLNELDREIKEMDYREANKRAGYVYVISNIGSFGENVYKIGMTRRLEPMDRVDELGSASVPFKFDVHAMIFSEDAPKLEAALHRAFDSKKVNMVNNRKEFFKVTLEEIEKVVKDNFERAVEFISIPNAEQYRETLKIMSLDKNN